jgi:alpha-methylacyl-CoA racemase
VLLRLVERADALIEGFRPGVLERLGCDWDTLHAFATLSSSFARSRVTARPARWRKDAGHDINYIALAGVLDQIRANGHTAIPSLQLGDLLGGALTALYPLLMIAARRPQRSGVGSLHRRGDDRCRCSCIISFRMRTMMPATPRSPNNRY